MYLVAEKKKDTSLVIRVDVTRGAKGHIVFPKAGRHKDKRCHAKGRPTVPGFARKSIVNETPARVSLIHGPLSGIRFPWFKSICPWITRSLPSSPRGDDMSQSTIQPRFIPGQEGRPDRMPVSVAPAVVIPYLSAFLAGDDQVGDRAAAVIGEGDASSEGWCAPTIIRPYPMIGPVFFLLFLGKFVSCGGVPIRVGFRSKWENLAQAVMTSTPKRMKAIGRACSPFCNAHQEIAVVIWEANSELPFESADGSCGQGGQHPILMAAS